MAAHPPRLITSAHPQQDNSTEPRSEVSLAADLAEGEEIPIFCAGGCGEVIGFMRKGQSFPTSRCPRCEAVEVARRKALVSEKKMIVEEDELAELRSPPRDLRLIHMFQVAAVALIFAGSICIAIGRPLGIYLAAFGTLLWIAIAVVCWRRRSIDSARCGQRIHGS